MFVGCSCQKMLSNAASVQPGCDDGAVTLTSGSDSGRSFRSAPGPTRSPGGEATAGRRPRGRRPAPGISRLGTRLLEIAENVVYAGIAAFLVATALVCLVLAGKTTWGLVSDFSEQPILDLLDILLLVFIVVELLFAVRTTVEKRELLAEPFLLVGIIASIKEIVVLSVEAAKEVGNGARVRRPDHRDRRARRPRAAPGSDVVPAPPQGAGTRRGGQLDRRRPSVRWADPTGGRVARPHPCRAGRRTDGARSGRLGRAVTARTGTRVRPRAGLLRMQTLYPDVRRFVCPPGDRRVRSERSGEPS